jgi:hypothetical protein
MLDITWSVHLEGGEPFEVKSKARDIVNFENRYNVSSSALAAKKVRNADGSVDMDSSHIRQEWLLFLAYSAANRAGKFSGEFLDFVDALEEFPTIVAQAAAVPTNAGA